MESKKAGNALSSSLFLSFSLRCIFFFLRNKKKKKTGFNFTQFGATHALKSVFNFQRGCEWTGSSLQIHYLRSEFVLKQSRVWEMGKVKSLQKETICGLSVNNQAQCWTARAKSALFGPVSLNSEQISHSVQWQDAVSNALEATCAVLSVSSDRSDKRSRAYFLLKASQPTE